MPSNIFGILSSKDVISIDLIDISCSSEHLDVIMTGVAEKIVDKN